MVLQLRTFWKRLTHSAFVRNVALLSSGSAIQNVGLLAASPILARLFSPDDFGIAAIIYAAVGIVGPLASGSYDAAIVVQNKRSNAIHAYWVALIFALMFCCVVFVIVQIFYNYIPYPPTQWAEFAAFIPLIMVLVSWLQASRSWATREKDYIVVFRNHLLETLSMIGVQLIAGFAAIGPVGLLAGRAVGLAVACSHAI